MQCAKKLVLIDEEHDREYKRLQRPADVIAKTRKSVELSRALRDPTIADDQKVWEYIAALHRYLNVRKEVPEDEEEDIVEPTPPSPVLQTPATPLTRKRGKKNKNWCESIGISTDVVDRTLFIKCIRCLYMSVCRIYPTMTVDDNSQQYNECIRFMCSILLHTQDTSQKQMH